MIRKLVMFVGTIVILGLIAFGIYAAVTMLDDDPTNDPFPIDNDSTTLVNESETLNLLNE